MNQVDKEDTLYFIIRKKMKKVTEVKNRPTNLLAALFEKKPPFGLGTTVSF